MTDKKPENDEHQEINPDILRKFSEQDFLAERVRHLYQHTTVALGWITILVLVVLANVYEPGSGDLTGPIWAACMLALASVMGIIKFTYSKAAPKPEDARPWILPALIWGILAGAGWGAAGVLFHLDATMQQSLVVNVAIFGVTLGIISRLAAVQSLTQSFAALAMLPGVIFLAMPEPAPQAVGTAAIMGLLWLVTAMSAVRLHRHTDHVIELRFENRGLLDFLSRSKTQLETLNRELKNEVEGRKKIERKLKEAQHEAEAANMAKDEFLATMSHEIRTPLNGILPLLDILRDTKLDTDQKDYLNTAFQSSKHMLRLIDDILDYSKIEAGKLELESVSMNVSDLIDEAAQAMRGAAQRKNLSIRTAIDPNVRNALRGDPVRIRQILTNLLSNAVKFTEQGGVRIRVRKMKENTDTVWLRFSVQDTGVGINRETQSKLFHAFEQGDTSTTRQYGGTGLGLVICKRLIDLMHGGISVESEPGKGSIFWFEIPLQKSSAGQSGRRESLERVRALLLIGENRRYAQVRHHLESMGMDLLRADSLADTVNKLGTSAALGSSWAFELLLVDADLGPRPVLNLLKKIAGDDRLTNLRVALVGNTNEMRTELKKLGITTVIGDTKAPLEMQQKLESLLSVGAGPAAAGEADFIARPVDTSSKERNPALAGKVLLVEDNPVNLRVAQKLLGMHGLNVESAGNGKVAMERIQQEPFDLVLMDCQMPIMDGYQATRAIRESESGDNLTRLPIVAMTANAMSGDREKCLDAGMDDYLSKPLNRDVLARMLKKWLPTRESTERSETSSTENWLDPDTGGLEPPEPTDSTEPEEARSARGGRELPEVAASIGQEAIDENIIAELIDVMGEDFSMVLDAYLSDTPDLLQAMEAAAAAHDAEAMVNPSHSLKSTSANFGAMKLSRMAEKLELRARSGDITGAPRLVERAHAEYEVVKEVLHHIRREANAG
jgi:signal transduction histidine kinase/CheY-like chemotaxis protein/HPt (histidine-containing phosphotransfer) domain-containing protein